jgi:hypothetical protein
MDPLEPKRRARSRQVRHNKPGGATGGTGGGAVSEFAQLALYMAASLAGMVTAMLVARRPFFESLMRNVRGRGAKGDGDKPARPRRAARGVLRPTAEESLPMLAEAIIGNTKAAVASVFGPPRSAALRGIIKPGSKAPAYWQANTWYYALPRNDALAMAIEFLDDAARRVEFIRAPGL